MVSTGGGIVLAIIVILFLVAAGWIIFTQLRARRNGLPAPTLSSYLPWKRSSDNYGAPRPAPGGIVGWFNDQIRSFKNRNNRSAAGAYESHGAGPSTRRGFGALDPDEAWDTRVGGEADGYLYDETELSNNANRGGGGAGGRDTYQMNVPEPSPYGGANDLERGRAGGLSNPFDDDHAVGSQGLRGVSPRPLDTSVGGHGRGRDSEGSSPTESRRSVFRENV